MERMLMMRCIPCTTALVTAMLAAGFVVSLVPGDACAGRRHKPVQRIDAGGKAPETTQDAQEGEAAPRIPYPLYLWYGEALGPSGGPEPLVPGIDSFLTMLTLASHLVSQPWNFTCAMPLHTPLPDGPGHAPWDSADRAAYLGERLRILDGLHDAAAELLAMARSLEEAGEWSAGDVVLAGIEVQKIALARETAARRFERIRETRAGAEAGTGGFLRRRVAVGHDPPGFFLPPDALEEAEGMDKSLKRYEEDLLPSLKETLDALEEAHDSREVGLAKVLRIRFSYYLTRSQYLDQAACYNQLMYRFEKAAGGTPPAAEGRP